MKNIALLFVIYTMLHSQFAEASRLKDIASIKGVRENQLVGYGLVVGLKGTGDGKSDFTKKSLLRMLESVASFHT